MPIPATNRPRTEFKPELFYFWRHDPGTGALSQQEWKLQFEAHITSLNDTVFLFCSFIISETLFNKFVGSTSSFLLVGYFLMCLLNTSP